MSERWKLRCYLAGWSKDLEFRRYAIENYGDKFDLVDPMTVTWKDVNNNVPKNITSTWLVTRDKKLINSCDIMIARYEILPEDEYSIGTLMEIMYAYDHGIPVYFISENNCFINNAWIKFHYKIAFKSIDECFEYLGG